LAISNLGNYNLQNSVYPETLIESPVNPQCLNRYTYVLNNPLKYTDPNGFNTVAFGLYDTAGFLGGIDTCAMVVFDDKMWNYRWNIDISIFNILSF